MADGPNAGQEQGGNTTPQSPAALFTVDQLADGIKQRIPQLKDIPNDLVVRRALESKPEMIKYLQTSEPRKKMKPVEPNQNDAPENQIKAILGNKNFEDLSFQEKAHVIDLGFKAYAQHEQYKAHDVGGKGDSGWIARSLHYIKSLMGETGGVAVSATGGMADPKTAATVATGVVAPEVPAAIFAGEALSSLPNQIGTAVSYPTPENVQQALLIGSVAAGAGAGAVEGVKEVGRSVKSKVEPTARNVAQSMTGTGREPIITETRERATRQRGHEEAHAVDVEKTAEINKERAAGHAKDVAATEQANKEAQAAHAKDVEKVAQENADRQNRYTSRVSDIKQRYEKKVAGIKSKYAADVAEREKKVAELEGQYQRDVTKAREDWVRDAYEADKRNVGFQGQGGSEAAKVEAAKNKHEAMKRAEQAYTDMVDDNVKGTHKVVRGSLDGRYNAIRETKVGDDLNPHTIREVPLDSSRIESAIEKGREQLQGAPADLKVFNDLMHQMEEAGEEDPAQEVGKEKGGTKPKLRPLTWDEGRTHFTALGDKLYSGELPGNIIKALKTVRLALDSQLEESAVQAVTEKYGAQRGAAMRAEYRQLKQDWAQYEADWRDTGSQATGGSPLAHLLKSVDRPIISGHVLGKFSDRLLMTFARYKDFGADPAMMSRFRNLSTEEKSLGKTLPGPKAKPITPPGKFTPPEAPAPPAEVKEPKIPEPHRIPEPPKPHEAPEPPKLKEPPEPPKEAKPSPLKVEEPVNPFEIRIKRLERLAGDSTGTWRLWRKGIRWLLLKDKIREWVASQARDVDPDFIPNQRREKLSPERQQKILKDAVSQYRMLEKQGQTSLKDYLRGSITREGLRQRTQALFPEVPAKDIEEYLDFVDRGKGITMVKPKGTGSTPAAPSSTPTTPRPSPTGPMNPPASTTPSAMGDEAMRATSDFISNKMTVQQLTNRLRAIFPNASEDELDRMVMRASVAKLKAMQAPKPITAEISPDIGQWQPPPELGVTSAPDYGLKAREGVEKKMGGPLPRGTSESAPKDKPISIMLDDLLGSLKQSSA